MDRTALSPAALWSMIKESVAAWSDDFAPSMGAAIAYYTAFSIAPLLIIVIAIAGFFFGKDAASGYLYAQIAGSSALTARRAVQGMVESASNTDEGVFATVVGVVLLIIGATTVFAELQSDLDRIWKAPAAKKTEGLWGMLRGRVLSFGLVVSIGFLMLVSLVSAPRCRRSASGGAGCSATRNGCCRSSTSSVSLAVVTVMFALMYKILPRVKIGWHDVWIGAAVTALLFTIGKFLVGLYVGKASVASTFGAAGSLAVLLVWVYYSAQIFFLGAEFTGVYAHRYGSRKGKEKPATEKGSIATTGQPRGSQEPPRTAPPQPALETPVPALRPRQRAVTAFALRHLAAMTGVAVLLGAAVSELAKRRR